MSRGTMPQSNKSAGVVKVWFEVEYKPPKRRDVTVKVVGAIKGLGKGAMRSDNHTLEHDDSYARDLFRSYPKALEIDIEWLKRKGGRVPYKYYVWNNDCAGIIEDETDVEQREVKFRLEKVYDGYEIVVKDHRFGDLSRPPITQEVKRDAMADPYAALDDPFDCDDYED